MDRLRSPTCIYNVFGGGGDCIKKLKPFLENREHAGEGSLSTFTVFGDVIDWSRNKKHVYFFRTREFSHVGVESFEGNAIRLIVGEYSVKRRKSVLCKSLILYL